ncbi:MAG TPA: nucleotidyltransferase family protein, partial [Gaiellaceae bacterium]|nr:nucleotidyltransferase family protein [Gaiellaceae bacterium]
TSARSWHDDASMGTPPSDEALAREAILAAGTSLAADHIAVEAAAALRAVSVASLLLRGASVARHLYDNGETRAYVDADLLVPAGSRTQVERVLRKMGFSHRAVLGQRSIDRPAWSSTWFRDRDGGTVDLHWSLVGVRVGADELWSTLLDHAESIPVLGVQLDGLDAEATALVVVLHAAHHGQAVPHPLADLERALDRFDGRVWQRAIALAERLEAGDAFAAGLRLRPNGVQLAARLGLPESSRTETVLRAASAPPMALGFEWLAQTQGVKRKLVFVAGKLIPDVEFMRAWSPVAGRGGSLGLALAYVWRPIWLLVHSGRGFWAWWQARRPARR